MERSFEKLKVWQKSRMLVKIIYQLTAKFPPSEKFGLADQMKRAAISVASNLAEGTSRISYKEKAHFCEISYGSMMEVSCQLFLAVDLGYLNSDETLEAQSLIDELDIQLCSFRKALIFKANSKDSDI